MVTDAKTEAVYYPGVGDSGQTLAISGNVEIEVKTFSRLPACF